MVFHQLVCLLEPVGQSDSWESEGGKPRTLGAGGEGRGKTPRHHDDEEKGKVPVRQDHVWKKAKSPRGTFSFYYSFNMYGNNFGSFRYLTLI